ncbi:hypothetical protein LTS10_010513 [Elasticomyces elasticus]|nr:hypothetical protein LTS10_010513 [Elasticomyces elasticus]
MADQRWKRKYQNQSPGLDTTRQMQFTSVNGSRDHGDTTSRSDRVGPPPAKKVKTALKSTNSSTAVATIHPAKAVSVLPLPYHEWTLSVLGKRLDIAEVAGYLNLANAAQIVDLWETCKEALWRYYKHDQGQYCETEGSRFAGWSGILQVLDQGLVVRSEDITSDLEPTFVAFSRAYGCANWHSLLFARFAPQVFAAVAKDVGSNKIPNVFSGARTGRGLGIVAKDTLGWTPEDIRRVAVIWSVYCKTVRDWPGPKQFSFPAAKKIWEGIEAKLPDFRNNAPRDDGPGSAPARTSTTGIVRDASFPLTPALTTSAKTPSSHGMAKSITDASHAHSTDLPDDLERSVREMSVSANTSDGPIDLQSAATTTHLQGPSSPMFTKQTSPSETRSDLEREHEKLHNVKNGLQCELQATKQLYEERLRLKEERKIAKLNAKENEEIAAFREDMSKYDSLIKALDDERDDEV